MTLCYYFLLICLRDEGLICFTKFGLNLCVSMDTVSSFSWENRAPSLSSHSTWSHFYINSHRWISSFSEHKINPARSETSASGRKDMNSPPAAESEEHRSMWSRREGEQVLRSPSFPHFSSGRLWEQRGRRRGSCRLTGPSGSCFPSLIIITILLLVIIIIITTAQSPILGSFIQHLRACNVGRTHLPGRFRLLYSAAVSFWFHFWTYTKNNRRVKVLLHSCVKARQWVTRCAFRQWELGKFSDALLAPVRRRLWASEWTCWIIKTSICHF